MYQNSLTRKTRCFVLAMAACGAACPLVISRSAAETVLFVDGTYGNASDVLTLEISMPAPPASNQFYFRSYANGGGTARLGGSIASGGIDSVLAIYDSSYSLIGMNDDFNYPTTGRDSYIHTNGLVSDGASTSIPAPWSGHYHFVQTVFGSGLNNGHFALNVVTVDSPFVDGAFTVEGISASAGVTVDHFWLGQKPGPTFSEALLYFASPADSLTANDIRLYRGQDISMTAGNIAASTFIQGYEYPGYTGYNNLSSATLAGGNLTTDEQWWGLGEHNDVIIDHMAGSNTASAQLHLGNGSKFTNVTYNLSGSGMVSAPVVSLGGNDSSNIHFVQTGGTAVFGQLYVQVSPTASSSSLYRLSGGMATLDSINLGQKSVFELSGGMLVLTHDTNSLSVTNPAGGAQFNWLSGIVQAPNFTLDDPAAHFFGPALALTAGKALQVFGTTTVGASQTLTLDGGSLTTGTLVVNGNFAFHSGMLTITQAGAIINTPILTGPASTINIDANNVSLGGTTSFLYFNHQGVLNVGVNTVTLNSAGYARLGVLTTLANGAINAPNGVTFGSGSNLLGHGTVNARVTGEGGAVIESNGRLVLGDSTSAAGFNFGGELRTRQYDMTLNSSAAAGLGNLTVLGASGIYAGNLTSTNGFVVDFDEVISGYGTIDSTNALAKRATINGSVQGISPTRPITFTGYITGLGTFDNTTFSGTYSPGLSSAVVTVGNIALDATNTLVIELGGTTAGSGYDQIQASGTLNLGGALQVILVNGFTPAAGNSFNVLDWVALAGTFSSISLPTLTDGKTWNTSLLYTTGVLSVVGAHPGDFDGDGDVDGADFVAWQTHFPTASGATLADGDADGDGDVDGADFVVWQTNFPFTPGSAVVPEPNADLLATIGFLGLCVAAIGKTSAADRQSMSETCQL